jgi:hypothetical protein
VSRSFYSDGLFRLPHEKDGSPPPGWFEPNMVYDWRDPGVVCFFPTITQEFLRWVRATTERRAAAEVKTTVGTAIDLTTPSAPPMKTLKPKQLLRKQARQPSTAAQMEGWRLKEAARSRGELTLRGSKRRRNASSPESSPTREVEISVPAPLGSANADVPSARVATPPRSRFVHDIEVEADDDGDYESDADCEGEQYHQSEREREVKKTTTILWSKDLWSG